MQIKRAYDSFVKDPHEDFVGMVAYTLYKVSKIEYINDYKERYGGSEPDDHTLKEWQQTQLTPGKIENYKELAGNKVNLFVNMAFEIKSNAIKQTSKDLQLKESALSHKERNLKDKEKELNHKEKRLTTRDTECPHTVSNKFWNGVWQSFVATILFTVITIALVLITKPHFQITELFK